MITRPRKNRIVHVINRRALIKALASLPVVAVASAKAAAPASTTAAQFDKASTALTGYPSPSSDDTAKMLAAFATPDRREALIRLARIVGGTPASQLDAALRDNGLDTLANDLVAAWYTGVVTNGKAQRLVLYTDAYVWSAMSFTKPMGICGGVTGYWKDPPA